MEVKEQFKSYYHFHKDKGEDFQHGGQRVKGIFKQSTDLRPLISVITAVYNGGQYLEESIDSIKTQNYQNFEHIIIDGCSTDKTPDIIKRNENNIDYWISEKDKGIYDAFSTVIKYFKNNKDLDFLFGPVKKHWGLLHGYKPWKIRFSWGFYSSHSTGFFIKKNAAKKIGFYNLAYKYSSDYDYFYRMIVKLKMRGTSTKKDEIFGIFRRGGFSSKINFIDHFFETIKIRLDNGQNKFLVLLIFILKYLKNNQKF